MRELTSQALHNLTERDPEYMKGEGEPVTSLASSLGGGCESRSSWFNRFLFMYVRTLILRTFSSSHLFLFTPPPPPFLLICLPLLSPPLICPLFGSPTPPPLPTPSCRPWQPFPNSFPRPCRLTSTQDTVQCWPWQSCLMLSTSSLPRMGGTVHTCSMSYALLHEGRKMCSVVRICYCMMGAQYVVLYALLHEGRKMCSAVRTHTLLHDRCTICSTVCVTA